MDAAPTMNANVSLIWLMNYSFMKTSAWQIQKNVDMRSTKTPFIEYIGVYIYIFI